jgi:uncharacterized protein
VPPAPAARVNDYASLLTPGDRTRLEELLAGRERATGVQMVVAIFRSLEGENLEDFAIRLAEQWRIGQKGLDNGVILLVFVDDRKVRLEVGYGLEPVIPDAIAGAIIRDAIAPRFREGRYAAGLTAAVEAVFARVASGPAARAEGRGKEAPTPWTLLGFGAILLVIALVLGHEMMSTRRHLRRNGYTTSRRRGWAPPVVFGPPFGWPGGRRPRDGAGFTGGGGFSGGGGGRFGGGGASGSW